MAAAFFWNKGKLDEQKAPLKLRQISAIRVRLELGDRKRELALFNLALYSKLRGCDLVQLRVRVVGHGDRIAARAIVMQQKTQPPIQFEITEQTRKAVFAWIPHAALRTEDYLFPSRLRLSPHLSTRQYTRIVEAWVSEIGLDAGAYHAKGVLVQSRWNMSNLLRPPFGGLSNLIVKMMLR